jgi:hypothetical protein
MEGSSPRSPKHSTISIAAWGVNGGKEGATCKTVLLENKGSRVSGKRCSARTKQSRVQSKFVGIFRLACAHNVIGPSEVLKIGILGPGLDAVI